jgi:hypothetical protein
MFYKKELQTKKKEKPLSFLSGFSLNGGNIMTSDKM